MEDQEKDDVFTIELTAATVVDGEIAVAGELVEVSRKEAENIIGRGRAKLASPEKLAEIEKRAQEEAKQIKDYQEAQLVAQIAGQKQAVDKLAARKEELEKLTLDELKALAADKGHQLGDATKKADIIAAIQKAEKGE